VGKTSDGREFAVVADQKLDKAYLYYRTPGTNNFIYSVDVASSAQMPLLAPGAAQTFIVPGDSNPYLVFVNSLSNDVLLYHYDPAVGFKILESVQVGDNPVSVTVADINGDGVPDLIVANKGSNDVSVLIGNTTAGYWAAKPYQRLHSGGLGPVGVAVQDATGANGPNLLVTNGDGTVTTLVGIGANGKGSGFFQDSKPNPIPVAGKIITGTVFDPGAGSTGLTFAMANDGTVGVLAANGVLTPLHIDGFVTRLTVVDSFLAAGFANGSVELLSTDGTVMEVSAPGFSAAPGALEVLQNGDNFDVIALNGDGVPVVVPFELPGDEGPGNVGNGPAGFAISIMTTVMSSSETAAATPVAGFDLVLVATLLPGELTESLTATVAAAPDAATFAVFLAPDGGGGEVVQVVDAEQVDAAPAVGTATGDSPEAAPLENYLLGVSDALEQRLQDKQLKDGVEDFMDALKAALDQFFQKMAVPPPQAPPPAKVVPTTAAVSQPGDVGPAMIVFEAQPVEARAVPASAVDADIFLGADLPPVAAPRWTPEKDGPAWSSADVRPALLAACLAWRMEAGGCRTEQEERRRADMSENRGGAV
jgi:hypothetical protein